MQLFDDFNLESTLCDFKSLPYSTVRIRSFLILLLPLFLSGCCCTLDEAKFPKSVIYDVPDNEIFSNPRELKSLKNRVSAPTYGYAFRLGAADRFIYVSHVSRAGNWHRGFRLLPKDKADHWQFITGPRSYSEGSDDSKSKLSSVLDWYDSSGEGFYIVNDSVFEFSNGVSKYIAANPASGKLVSISGVNHKGRLTAVVMELARRRLLIHWWDRERRRWIARGVTDCESAGDSVFIAANSKIQVLCRNRLITSSTDKDNWSSSEVSLFHESSIRGSYQSGHNEETLLNAPSQKSGALKSKFYLVRDNKIAPVFGAGLSSYTLDALSLDGGKYLLASTDGVYEANSQNSVPKKILNTRCPKLFRSGGSKSIYAFCFSGGQVARFEGSLTQTLFHNKARLIYFDQIFLSTNDGKEWSDVTAKVGLFEI